MSRSIEVKNQITKFLKSTKSERRSLLTFGVEFEYQQPGSNIDHQTICEAEYEFLDALDFEERYDTDRASEHEWEYIEDEFSRMSLEDAKRDGYLDCLDHGAANSDVVKLHFSSRAMGYHKTWRSKRERRWRSAFTGDWDKMFQRMLSLEIDRWRSIDGNDVGHSCSLYEFFEWSRLIDEDIAREQVTSAMRDDGVGDIEDWSDYEYDVDDLKNDYAELWAKYDPCIADEEVTTEYEHVGDCSVSGGEVRTRGGLDYIEFRHASRTILNDINRASTAYVDENCSAHLHLKLGDIRHYYGKGILHGLILEYFYFNFHRLPESVKTRLKDGGNRHIRPNLESGKYNWVRFHPQGTIEFRLFGNIDDHTDFEICIDMAIEALAYAYRVKALRSKSEKFLLSRTWFDAKAKLSAPGFDIIDLARQLSRGQHKPAPLSKLNLEPIPF